MSRPIGSDTSGPMYASAMNPHGPYIGPMPLERFYFCQFVLYLPTDHLVAMFRLYLVTGVFLCFLQVIEK